MTNPIKFLFESLSFISYETQLLEACDWDEERLDFVKSELENILSGLALNTAEVHEDFIASIKKQFSKILREKESSACLHIIEECMENFSHTGDSSYEN